MSDPYSMNFPSPMSFGRRGRLITPAAADIVPIAKSICLPAGGDVTIVPVNNANNETISFVGLSPGQTVPYQVRRVTAASSAVWSIED